MAMSPAATEARDCRGQGKDYDNAGIIQEDQHIICKMGFRRTGVGLFQILASCAMGFLVLEFFSIEVHKATLE